MSSVVSILVLGAAGEGERVDGVNGRCGRQRGTALEAGSEGEGDTEPQMRDEMEQWGCR
jgi:hypothetical protein